MQELYNTSIWGPESYYDELAKGQKTDMDKKDRKGTKVVIIRIIIM